MMGVRTITQLKNLRKEYFNQLLFFTARIVWHVCVEVYRNNVHIIFTRKTKSVCYCWTTPYKVELIFPSMKKLHYSQIQPIIHSFHVVHAECNRESSIFLMKRNRLSSTLVKKYLSKYKYCKWWDNHHFHSPYGKLIW